MFFVSNLMFKNNTGTKILLSGMWFFVMENIWIERSGVYSQYTGSVLEFWFGISHVMKNFTF